MINQFKELFVETLKTDKLYLGVAQEDNSVKKLDNHPNNSADFLYNFLSVYNYKYYTYLLFDNSILTGAYKNRSIQETYQLLVSYFENYSIEDYLKDIYEVIYRFSISPLIENTGLKNLRKRLIIFRCPDIDRCVFSVCNLYNTTGYYCIGDKFKIKFSCESHIALDNYHNSRKLSKMLRAEELANPLISDKYINAVEPG